MKVESRISDNGGNATFNILWIADIALGSFDFADKIGITTSKR